MSMMGSSRRANGLASLVLVLLVGCASPVLPQASEQHPSSTPSVSTAPTNSPSLVPSATPSSSPSPPAAPSSSAASAPPSGPSALDRARADLDRLVSSLETIHPEPYHGIARDDFLAEMDALSDALPGMTQFEAQVGLQRVVGLLSREGRDGHQFAMPLNDVEAPALPITVYEFDDGVYVTAALAPHGDLVGSRVEALEGRPIGDVLDALEPLVPRDGPATVRGFRPTFMLRTSVLEGLGLIEDGAVSVSTSDGGEDVVETELEPVPFIDWLDWKGGFGIPLLPARDDTMFLSDPGPTFWSEFLPEWGVLYIRYEQVVAIDATALAAAFDRASADDVEAVILDLRQNTGGDNNRYVGLLRELQEPHIDRPGRLFVLTDRLTFSAASNLATEIEQSTGAIFAGEPMGGGLNFWDDVRQVRLDDYVVPMDVGVSTRYWQKSTPDDPRLTIDPDIAVPVLASDYFAGRDPVLEQILTGL